MLERRPGCETCARDLPPASKRVLEPLAAARHATLPARDRDVPAEPR